MCFKLKPTPPAQPGPPKEIPLGPSVEGTIQKAPPIGGPGYGDQIPWPDPVAPTKPFKISK